MFAVDPTASTTSLNSTPHSGLEPLCKMDSCESVLLQAGLAMEEDLKRLSLSSAISNRISFNFSLGAFDFESAFRVLEGEDKGKGLTPSTSSNSMASVSFHSAKELEDYIEGRDSADSGEAEANTNTNTTTTTFDSPTEEESFPSTPAPTPAPTPRNSVDCGDLRSKTGSTRSQTSFWRRSGRVSFTTPGEAGGDRILQQGQLEWESSKSSSKWKSRQWILSGSTLGYYKRNGTLLRSAPKFVPAIDLRRVVEVFHDKTCFLLDEFCFGVDVGTTRHYFKAGSKEEMATWMVALARQKKALGQS